MRKINKESRLFLLPRWLFRKFRGQARDDGAGKRELSSGILSDRVRDGIIAKARSYPGDLLEIGCGEGIFLKEMMASEGDAGHRLVGLELFFRMLAKTQRVIGDDRKRLDFVQASGEQMPFRDGSFARVVCVNIFYNIPSMALLEKIIAEAGRVLRKDGVFIFEIRNKYNPLMYLLYHWVGSYDTSIGDLPLNTYFYHEISRILRRHRLQVIDKKGVFIPLWFLSPVFIITARKE